MVNSRVLGTNFVATLHGRCHFSRIGVAMLTPVRKMGNSSGIIIPKLIMTQIGIETGDDLDLSLDEGRIVLSPVKRHPRSGWAEASKRIAKADDDGLVWPEFGNADDAHLKW